MTGTVLAAALLLSAPGLDVTVANPDLEGAVLLDVSYPGWGDEEGEWEVLVDGAPARFEFAGYGSGGGRETRTLRIEPGWPGRKEVVVVRRGPGGERRGRVSFDFAPAPAILPDWIDGQIALGPTALRVRFRWVDQAGIEVRVNGETVPFSFEKGLAEGLHVVTAVVLDPPLVPGTNRIEVSAATSPVPLAAPLVSRTTLYFAPRNRVFVGGEFLLPLGRVGSRSGPFYTAEVEGDAIRPTGMEVQDDLFVSSFRAVRPGAATIRVYVKPHFTQRQRLEREIPILVVEE